LWRYKKQIIIIIITTTTTVLWPSVPDYRGESVPEETLTHHPDHHPIFISFFHGPLSGTTWVSLYQKKHSPDHHPIFISFFHLL